MQGSTINEAIGAVETQDTAQMAQEAERSGMNLSGITAPVSGFLDKLKAKTGEGDITQYENHVLNFRKSPAIAKILRGVTGIFGEVNLAIVDIMIGMFEIMQEKKGGVDRG